MAEGKRAHFKVKGRRIKKDPAPPYIPPPLPEPPADRMLELRTNLGNIKTASLSKNLLNNITFDNRLYFIIHFVGKISWKSTQSIINHLSIEIKEIIGDYTIKASLERDKYDVFFIELERFLNEIINISQVSLEDKFSSQIYDAVISNPQEYGSYTLEFSDISELKNKEEIEKHIKKYTEGYVNKLYDAKNVLLFSVYIKNNELLRLADSLDSITLIEEMPEIELTPFNVKNELDFIETGLLEGETDDERTNICIIDSGIYQNHRKIKDSVYATFDLTTHSDQPCEDLIPHGTCVSGFAIYGKDDTHQIPSANVIMIKNYISSIHREVENIVAIQDAIRIFKNKFKILNLSFSSKKPNSSYTKILDEITYKNKLVTVVSAGNVSIEKVTESVENGDLYPEFLSNFSIFFPGDCRNVITVGSCTHKPTNIAPNNAPSPFTRSNPNPNYIKPDLVEIGGNLSKIISNGETIVRSNGYGLSALSNRSDILLEKVGTSFSTPIVSNYLAQLYQFFGIESPALLKALLLSTCTLLSNENRIFDLSLQGFGKPNLERAKYSDPWRATYLYEGEFSSTRPDLKDRYKFWFPGDADLVEVTLVCEKSKTVYNSEKQDNLRLRIFHRPGASRRKPFRKSFHRLIGSTDCYNTYKGYYEVGAGSRGEWIFDIIPSYSTPELVEIYMRYGCVVSVIDTSKQVDIWQYICEDWLPEVSVVESDQREEDIGLLRPIVIQPIE